MNWLYGFMSLQPCEPLGHHRDYDGHLERAAPALDEGVGGRQRARGGYAFTPDGY